MVALTLALALGAGAWQSPQNVFTPESLGAAYEAFVRPESATIQAVYPAIRGEKVERDFAISKLRFVAKPRKVNPALLQRMIDNYRNPYRVLEPNCVFHPDHHVVLKRGEHVVETVSCFTCDELLVIADGKFLGRVSMGPPKMLRRIYSASVPLSDTIRAAQEEWLTREFVDALATAKSATIQPAARAENPKAMGQWTPQRSSVQGGAVFARRMLDDLGFHCLNNRLAMRFAQPDMSTAKPVPVRVSVGSHTLVLHGAYSRGELFHQGKWVRTIDLFGIEDRLQELVKGAIGKL